MKDIQILWAACKYHWRKFKNWFKEHECKYDEESNYYIDGDKRPATSSLLQSLPFLAKEEI